MRRLTPSTSCRRCSAWALAGSLVVLLLLGSGSGRSAEPKTKTNTNTNTNRPPEVSIPKSIFAVEGETGRDPFFPNSTRRKKRDDLTKPPPVRDYSTLLKLTGIAGGVRPIATINALTFAAGEEQEVKVEGGKAKIRVLEIREKSVVVTVEGQAKPIELKLRDVNLKFDE